MAAPAIFPCTKIIGKYCNIKRQGGGGVKFRWTSARFSPKVSELVTDSSLRMSRPAPLSPAEKARNYRQRLRASGGEEVLFQLPRQTVAMLDALKERHGLQSRSQALLHLIEEKGAAAQ